ALADAGQRRFQVALDVVRERLERRDVDDLGFVLEAAVEPLPHQAVDGGEKGRERLARSGGGGNQHVPPGLEGRPSLRLRRRGRSKAALKPGGNGRMKQGTWRHGTGGSGGMISLRRRPQRRRAARGEYRPRHMGLLPAESIRRTASSLPHRQREHGEFAGAARGAADAAGKTISSSPAWGCAWALRP